MSYGGSGRAVPNNISGQFIRYFQEQFFVHKGTFKALAFIRRWLGKQISRSHLNRSTICKLSLLRYRWHSDAEGRPRHTTVPCS